MEKYNSHITLEHMFDGVKPSGDRVNPRFDFYLPDIGILIEYDGAQHFSKNAKDNTRRLDLIRNDIARDLGILLIRIDYTVQRKVIINFIKNLLCDDNLYNKLKPFNVIGITANSICNIEKYYLNR